MKYCIEVIDNSAIFAPVIPTYYELEADDITTAWAEYERICEKNKYQGDFTFIFSAHKRPYLEVKDELCSWDRCYKKHNGKTIVSKWKAGKEPVTGKYCEEHFIQTKKEDIIISIA